MRARSREGLLETVAQIDRILEALDVTVREAKTKAMDFVRTPPTAFDLRGIGSLLHDFYTAIEDIFESLPGISTAAGWMLSTGTSSCSPG